MDGARGPGPITADGSPVEFYALLPDGGPGHERVAEAVAGARTVLDLGCGTGRLSNLLVERGQVVTAVDNSPDMLERVRGAETVLGDIERLDLRPRSFDAVVLASNLVNVSDDEQRRGMLRCCRRHVAEDGAVVIERFDPQWASTVTEGVLSDEGSVRISITGIRRDGRHFAAEMCYDAHGRSWRQPFVAHLLDDSELVDELTREGLAVAEWVDARLVVAKPQPHRPAPPAGAS